MPNQNNALEDLIWAIEASTGEFSLILAHCNYAELRRRMVEQLQEKCPVRIRKVTLPRRPESLFQTVLAETEKETPEALMVQGLESSLRLDEMLKAANQVREAFSKNFPFPLILWVNDAVLKRLIRVAPDLKSWAGSAIHFELSEDERLAWENIEDTLVM